MKLAIMQPYIFPYLGYFQLLHAVDKHVFYDDVNFIKQGWINRNRILIAGKPSYITVPLANASSFVPINSVEIIKNNWQAKWLKSLQQSYSRAPFFTSIFPLIESVIQAETQFISRLAIKSIKSVCEYLQIPTILVETSAHYQNNHLRAQERVLDICRQELSQQYINPIGGKDLYCKDAFLAHQIKLNFLQPQEIQYTHFSQTFEPWLSIIDVLMHNSREQVQQFLGAYQLV